MPLLLCLKILPWLYLTLWISSTFLALSCQVPKHLDPRNYPNLIVLASTLLTSWAKAILASLSFLTYILFSTLNYLNILYFCINFCLFSYLPSFSVLVEHWLRVIASNNTFLVNTWRSSYKLIFLFPETSPLLCGTHLNVSSFIFWIV